MRRTFYKLLGITLGALMCLHANSQEVNRSVTISWPFSSGTAGQTAVFADGDAEFFSSDYVTIGSKIFYKDSKFFSKDVTFTRFEPRMKLLSSAEDGVIAFHVKQKNGLTFTPSFISFDCMRFGTGGGRFDVKWRSSDGTVTVLQTGIIPGRDNNFDENVDEIVTHSEITITEPVSASQGEGVLELYLYSLDPGKQVGVANVEIVGQLVGTIVEVPVYSLGVVSSPVAGGIVTSSPVGSSFDQGTELTVSAANNFGYQFSHWADADGVKVSADNPYSFAMNGDVSLAAVFTPVNTFSLSLGVTGGAASYMVTPSPAGTMVDGISKYEEGTSVKLTAASNSILSFSNWSTGETSNELTLTMNNDVDLTAVYSVVDYLVGWDFYKSGNGGRVADFVSTVDNESSALVLRNVDGTVRTWLDKSIVSASGYEGKGAAVNWQNLDDKYYYQISFVATGYTDIRVSAEMLFNYNAYSVQKCEYSLDGDNFVTLGTYEMSTAKVWYPQTFSLPADVNHASKVYLRWIPDYTSSKVGTVSANDGTALAAIFVTGTATVYNDGIAPELQSNVPATGQDNASASGKIVLNFDEKVKIADGVSVSLDGKVLTHSVVGKTITFSYSGLSYDTQYSFTLPANTVSDLAGNTLTEAITISFKTMTRPVVTKKKFDFVVGVDGDFKSALAAATAASSSGKRFYIFFPNGQYDIGANTGDANQMTTISLPNVSYVGENSEQVVLYNKAIQESINSTATIYFTDAASNVYMQDLSLLNKGDFRSGSFTGRFVALWDKGDRNIYKNVKLLSNQDTYVSGTKRNYFETSDIHGTVDFICGGGDVFFNDCLIYLENRSGNCVTANASSSNWGYVFSNCIIDGFDINNGSYRLGRPWNGSPQTVFLNTTMKQLPTAEGWGDPMNVVPSVYAEYNSTTASGGVVDLSSRRTSYTKDATTVTLNPVLSESQANSYTLENVLGGSDNWMPTYATEQVPAPSITISGATINWDNSDYVLCWAVSKDGVFQEFVTTNSYAVPQGTSDGVKYTVRAANEMGGLSPLSNEVTYSAGSGNAVVVEQATSQVIDVQYYSLDGVQLSANQRRRGVVMVRTIYADGRVVVAKILNRD
ncbi:pectin methylesterase-like acyl-CoA thioesterase [Breznakibacter xylanolyticus]|uniref:Pectin methylesterase-like acyl-CoA thioesterase n=2 Tax=Breznakibacter xylanolyticus TaxID=990 RepID=A0A2W7NU71_9BACT|nr:pectin methylesterase-like acyl-CoA thioesterase [Breznakibacter xylanolyticus]